MAKSNEKQKIVSLSNAQEDQVQKEISQGVKSEVIDIYQELFETLWERITPTLGGITARTIFSRAVERTQKTYGFMSAIKVNEKGLDFEPLSQHVHKDTKEQLRLACKDLVANVFDILALLTGNVLVSQLLKEVEGKIGGLS